MIKDSYHLNVILLAAGKSERFKGIKLLANVQQDNPITLVQHVLQQITAVLNTLQIDQGNLLVATGVYHAHLAELIGDKFTLSYCDHADKGMGNTIAQSVKSVLENDLQPSHIMITLADQVALTTDDYLRLIRESLTTPDQLICAKVAEAIMPPAIFPGHYFEELMNLQGDKGAKAILYRNIKNLNTVSLPKAAVDIDTQQELTAWHNQSLR
jgi:molybdenum cofactor cytidylyltransferase